MIYTRTEVREKRSSENNWRSRPRGYPSDGPLWDTYKPMFTNCKLVASETNAKDLLDQYSVRWNGFPYVADMDIWISRETELVSRYVRTYFDVGWAFPEQRIAATFTYEGLKPISPQMPKASSDFNKTCEQVKQMIGRFNSADQIQATIQEIYSGTGDPSNGSLVIVGGKQYRKENGRSWYAMSRQTIRPEGISDCAFYGDEYVNGIPVSAFEYQIPDVQGGRQRVLTWIGKDNGLPVRQYIMTVSPENWKEWLVSYTYDPQVKEPD